MNGMLGKKLGMACVFAENGNAIPVTMIEAGPCFVTQVKTLDNDGYLAVQLGFLAEKETKTTKPQKGHFAKAGTSPFRMVREFREDTVSSANPGDRVTVDVFKEGDTIDVAGMSKGRGFAGTVKRHHFKGGPKTHGQSDRTRAPGSIGQSSDPSRVYKGVRMAGRMGNERVTVKNLTVIKVDAQQNLLMVKGAIPGPRYGIVEIRKV